MEKLEGIKTASQSYEEMKALFLSEQFKIFGLESDTTMDEVFAKYESIVTKKNVTSKKLVDAINAKNAIYRNFIENSMAEKGNFNVDILLKEKCGNCNGTGEIFRFWDTKVDIPCPSCKTLEHRKDESRDPLRRGRDQIRITCPTCKGTREFERVDKDLKIKVKCTKCDEEGMRWVTCQHCKGENKIGKVVKIPILRETTICPECLGLGIPEKKAKTPKLENKVLSKTLAETIKEQILDSPEVVSE